MTNSESELAGFHLVERRDVPEIRGKSSLFEHAKSGARILHIHTDDPENMFSINFRTVPPDDTGVTHIIEHSVLAGSQRFPVRDPFFEMLKMSMATFINAMTGPDCTYYPVCSNVRQDLLNLADVYFDAVFHPLMERATFQREGHHLAPEEPEAPCGALEVSGIVYNEMKSAISSPETSLYYRLNRALFPVGVYGRLSGGDPERIPDLTYDDFVDYLRRVYHPSNAYIVLYGDIPAHDYLEFLAPRLDAFDRSEPTALVEPEPRWTAPRRTEESYPVGDSDPDREQTFIVMEWAVGDATDIESFILLHLLSLVLLGNEAAPLRRAIIDSHLGQALTHAGGSSRGRQSTFGVGLKGSEVGRSQAFESLVMSCLSDLVATGIEPELVEAAFQQSEYHFREIDEGFPLEVLERVLHSWIHGSDPHALLSAGECLARCRKRYEADPALFARLIDEWLIQNPHRLTFTYSPDREMPARKLALHKGRMTALRDSMSDEEMRSLSEEAARLQEDAGRPNSPEALAMLPQLTRSDLPEQPRRIPREVEPFPGGHTLIVNDVFSNGINYLALEIDCSSLPDDLWETMPRFIDAVHKLGAGKEDFAVMARRISRFTGGISASPRIRTHLNGRGSVWGLQVSMRALDGDFESALDVLQDCLFDVNPRDDQRLKDVVVQSLAGYRTGLIRGGTATAIVHAARWLSCEGAVAQRVRGLPQLRQVEALATDFSSRHEPLMDDIERIREFIRTSSPLVASFTGSGKARELVRTRLQSWSKRRSSKRGQAPAVPTLALSPVREGLVAPIQVAHCAQLMPAPDGTSPQSVLLRLATKLVGVDYMMSEIRFKGNAYGAQCTYYESPGLLVLGSYADPHISRTLKVFEGLQAYVDGSRWSEVEVDRAVISLAKSFHDPLRPGSATSRSLEEFCTGRTDAFIAAQYATMLEASSDGIRDAMLGVLERGLPVGPVCVVSNKRMLEGASSEMGVPFSLETILSESEAVEDIANA